MGSSKYFILATLKLFIIVQCSGFKFDSTKPELFLDSCNDNIIFQESITDFISETISLHFSQCYIIQIRDQAPMQQYIHSAREIPTIDINLRPANSKTSVDNLNSRYGGGYIRFQKQCIIYHISLSGIENTSQESQLVKIFASNESQKRAKYSYIFINEFINHEIARRFLLHPGLKNYKHRVWTDIVNSDVGMPNQNQPGKYAFKFYYFCYYCALGEQGIDSFDKIYETSVAVETIEEIFPDITNNFQHHVMRITAPPAPPLVLISPSKSNPKVNMIHGQQRTILEGIASRYNFTYTLYSSPGGSTGSKLANGSWNGVMGEILHGRADIGLSVAIAYDRNEIADFTVSVFYAFLVLVSTKPIPVFEWQAIFYPFNATAWFAVIASTVMTLYLYQFLHNKSLPLEVPSRSKGKSNLEIMLAIKAELMTGFKAFYMTVGSLLEQGIPFTFNTMPSRMYATFWSFFAIIITCAYRSKLFAFLISPTIEIPPSSFEELSISDYTWGMKSLGGIALLFITHSPLQYIRDIGDKMDIYTDKYTCLDKTFHGKFTCIIYRAYIDYMMEVRYWKLRHQFHVSDFVTPPVGSAWALPKYSPLLPTFDKISFRIYEMGLADKYLVDYQVSFAKVARALAQASNFTADTFDLNSNFKNDDESGPRPLEMANVYGGFFILIVGLLIAFAVLLMEKVKHNKILKQEKVWSLMKDRMKIIKNHNKLNQQKVSFQQLVQVILTMPKSYST